MDGGDTWDDADAAPGPHIAAGSIVEFKFVVTNTGNGTLTYIEVIDSVLGYIGLIPFLEPGESFTFFVDDYIALAGQHTNIGTAVSESCSAIDTDPGNYFGEFECIDIEKLIMGDDADVAPGWIEWCIGCTIKLRIHSHQLRQRASDEHHGHRQRVWRNRYHTVAGPRRSCDIH